MGTEDMLEQGRRAFERRAWGDAYAGLAAGERDGLDTYDLERLAFAAYLTGRDDDALDALERAYHALMEQKEPARAVRCAFWLGMILASRGEHAPAGGWLARAQRVLDEQALDVVEQGYMLVPLALQAVEGGDPETGRVTFERVAEVAEHFGDPDLIALARLGRGRSLLALGALAEGVALLDEAMVAVTADEVSPVVAGIVYCAAILACNDVFDVRRAQEWTRALSRWCDAQQDLQPYRGQCLVHRSELMALQGEWAEALTVVRQAAAHMSGARSDPAVGMAQYQQAELLRLRGAFAHAEEAYRQASRSGHPVQPGLALLRLAQGRVADAEAAIRRVVEEAHGPLERCRVIAASVEIMLAVGDVDAARSGADELERLAADIATPYLEALAERARGAVLLAGGDAQAACAALRRSCARWHELDAPYEAAQTRLLLARACRDLEDHDTADLEVEVARDVFRKLGAGPALEQVEAVTRHGVDRAPGGLTPREIEVLRLLAGGVTNREIAEALVISEKTVSRHLSNMFTKLGVSSRAAATAYAYEHDLV